MPDIHIYVSNNGHEHWPRFIIRDSWGRFWTGETWATEEGKSQLFQDESEALRTAKDLYLNSKVRMFSTPLNIYVESEQPFSIEALQEFLARNCRGLIGNDEATPELKHSNIRIEVEWEHLEEIE